MTNATEDPLFKSPALARLLGGPPLTLDLLAGGRNSRVYRVTRSTGGPFALKAYFRHPGDSRDRLKAERDALCFMWDRGLTCVPQPLASDAEAGLGLFEFIAGDPLPSPTESDVDQAAAFLIHLHKLRLAPGAHGLSPASEARFSLRAMTDNVEARLQSLLEGAPSLAGFLRAELEPTWRQLQLHCLRECDRTGISFDQALPDEARTLSPSDFGFHNALRRNGALVFLDFEYFGWDDPSKMIADVLLHPGMDLSRTLRLRLVEKVLAGLRHQPDLRTRVKLAYPVLGIKWCLILLNEFLPGHLGRRQFAAPEDGSTEQRQARQLEKTRNLLQWIRDGHDPFTHSS